MILLIDSAEPAVLVRGEAARRVIDQVRLAVPESPAADGPTDFRSAMRRVEAEVYDAA